MGGEGRVDVWLGGREGGGEEGRDGGIASWEMGYVLYGTFPSLKKVFAKGGVLLMDRRASQ